MKRLLIPTLVIIMALGTDLSGQTVAEKQKIEEVEAVFKHLISKKNPDFLITEVPETMKKYSAVLLSRTLIHKYEIVGGTAGTLIYEGVRVRLKIQDQSSLEEFSEFFYPGEAHAEFQIIKPDGTSKSVDTDDAILVEENTGGGLFSYRPRTEYRKLAIPNLEVGDIIDYAFIVRDQSRSIQRQYIFPLTEINLTGRYPSIKQKIDLTVGKDFYVNCSSLNGAPSFKKVPHRTDFDYSNKSIKNSTRYLLEDGERFPVTGQYWTAPYREDPIVRFQVSSVFYLGNIKKYGKMLPFFYHSTEELTQGVSQQKIKADIRQFLENMELGYIEHHPDRRTIRSLLKEHSVRTHYDKAKLAYYHLRTKLFTDVIDTDAMNEDLDLRGLAERGLGWYEFYLVYKAYLEGMDIPYSVLIFVPQRFGTLDEIISFADFQLVFAIQDKGKTYFVRNPTFYSNFGAPYYSFDFSDYMTVLGRPVNIDFEDFASTHEDNQSNYNVNVVLLEDSKKLKISRQITHKGYSRLSVWYDLVTLEDYYFDDIKFMKMELPEESTRNKKRINLIQNTRNRVFEDLRKAQVEVHLTNVNEDLDIELEEVDVFEVVNTGRFEEEPELTYKDAFSTDVLLQQVGPNTVINVGALIGGQIELDNDDSLRTADIYMSYPRSYNYTISIAIPTGYTIDGIEGLNITEENATGGFRSEAKLEGDNLLVSTTKYYKSYSEPAENWPLMMDFLEAAYAFTQKKVVLKPQ